MSGSKVVGTITAGEWGHRVGLNLATAFVDARFADPDTSRDTGTALMLDLCGQHVPVKVIPPSPYDPTLSRARG